MTRSETRSAERLVREAADRRVTRRGLMKGAAAAGLAVPAAMSLRSAGLAAQDDRTAIGYRLLVNRAGGMWVTFPKAPKIPNFWGVGRDG